VDFVDSSNKDTGARFIDINGDGLVDILLSSNFGSVVKNVWINTGSGWVSRCHMDYTCNVYYNS